MKDLKTEVFNNEKCYIGYKGLQKDLNNFQNNYKYELNQWYSCLKVDTSEKDCSFGLNLCYDLFKGFSFGKRVFKCYIPIENNEFYFGKDKFRVKRFYLSDIEEILEYDWKKLSEYQKVRICYNPNFDSNKYWEELTEYQKDRICINNLNFDSNKYWKELTKDQKDLICEYNPNFNPNKYWKELTEYQKNKICEYNPNFDYEKYWEELTEHQKDILYTKIVIKK
jgi:hypothetical protein